MNHEFGLEIPVRLLCCLHTGECHYLFEGHKVCEYQADADLLNECGSEVKSAKE